jgi:hypothetical protein
MAIGLLLSLRGSPDEFFGRQNHRIADLHLTVCDRSVRHSDFSPVSKKSMSFAVSRAAKYGVMVWYPSGIGFAGIGRLFLSAINIQA